MKYLFIGGPHHLEKIDISGEPTVVQLPKKMELKFTTNLELEPTTFETETYYKNYIYFGPSIKIPYYAQSPKEKSNKLVYDYVANLIKKDLNPEPTEISFENVYKNINDLVYQKYKEHLQNIEIAKDYLTKGPLWAAASEFYKKKPTALDNLFNLFPQLSSTIIVKCPAGCNAFNYVKSSLKHTIIHLNDDHQWPIETKIADWLETLDIKLEVKNG